MAYLNKLEQLILSFKIFAYETIVKEDFEASKDKYTLFLSNFFKLNGIKIIEIKDGFSYLELSEVFDIVERYEYAFDDYLTENRLEQIWSFQRFSKQEKILQSYEKFVNDSIKNNSFDLEKNVKYLNELFHVVENLNSKNIEKTIELIELFHASNIKRLKPTKS